MDFGEVLEEIAAEAPQQVGRGKVASYIPALAGVSPEKFGMAIQSMV